MLRWDGSATGNEGYDEYYGYGILSIAGCIEALTGNPVIPSAIGTDYAACPKDSSCVIAAYADLDPGAWYHDGIHYALDNRIMNGVGEQRFSPNSPASRAMIATVVMRYLERFVA